MANNIMGVDCSLSISIYIHYTYLTLKMVHKSEKERGQKTITAEMFKNLQNENDRMTSERQNLLPLSSKIVLVPNVGVL
jgi:hypothetical protein